jgi:hypothetical protein
MASLPWELQILHNWSLFSTCFAISWGSHFVTHTMYLYSTLSSVMIISKLWIHSCRWLHRDRLTHWKESRHNKFIPECLGFSLVCDVKSDHAESGACVSSYEVYMHTELNADIANLDECGVFCMLVPVEAYDHILLDNIRDLRSSLHFLQSLFCVSEILYGL